MQNSHSNQLTADLKGLLPQNPFAPGVFKRIHSYRDNGTYADDALRAIKYFLLPVAALFTLAFGWALHFNIFTAWVGPTTAHISAGLFTAFIEVAKIFIGIFTIRLIIFGMFRFGIPDFFLMITMVAIFTGAFWWSYYNSTTGIQFAAQIASEWKIDRKMTNPTAAAAPLSKRIEKTEETAINGLNIKWKGKTTREGQKIAENSTAAIAEQEKQKTLLIQKEVDEQKLLDTHREKFINTTSGLFSNLGGKMEWFQLALIFSFVLCEKILWNRNPDKMQLSSRAPQQNNGYQFSRQSSPTGNFSAAMPPPAVNGLPTTPDEQLYHSVPQTNPTDNGIGADAVLKLSYGKIQRDLKNLEKPDGTPNGIPRTIADRIHAAMMEVGREAQKTSFKPSPRMATDFYLFIKNKVYPTLEQHKLQMQFAEEFLADIERFVDDTELELARQN